MLQEIQNNESNPAEQIQNGSDDFLAKVTSSFNALKDTNLPSKTRKAASDRLFALVKGNEDNWELLDEDFRGEILTYFTERLKLNCENHDLQLVFAALFCTLIRVTLQRANEIAETTKNEIIQQLLKLHGSEPTIRDLVIVAIGIVIKNIEGTLSDDEQKQLRNILDEGLRSTFENINFVAGLAVSTILGSKNKTIKQIFRNQYPLILVLVQKFIEKQDNEKAEDILECLKNSVDEQPVYCFEELQTIFRDDLQKLLENEFENWPIVHCLTDLFIRVYILQDKNEVRSGEEIKLIKDIVQMLVKQYEEPNDEWYVPSGNAKLQHEMKKAEFLSRVIPAILKNTKKEDFPKIINHFLYQEHCKSQWRYRCAILSIIAPVWGQSDRQCSENVLEFILSSTNDQNPMIRYSALKAIQSLVVASNTKFYPLFIEKLVPLMINYLDDPVPRIKGRAILSLYIWLGVAKNAIKSDQLKMMVLKLFNVYKEDLPNWIYDITTNCLKKVFTNNPSEITNCIGEFNEYFIWILRNKTEDKFEELRHAVTGIHILMIKNGSQDKVRESTKALVLNLIQETESIINMQPDYLEFYLETLRGLVRYVVPDRVSQVMTVSIKLVEFLLDETVHKLPLHTVKKCLNSCCEILGVSASKMESDLELFGEKVHVLWKQLINVDQIDEEIEYELWFLQFHILGFMKKSFTPVNSSKFFQVSDSIHTILIEKIITATSPEEECQFLKKLKKLNELIRLQFGSKEVIEKLERMILQKIEEGNLRLQQYLLTEDKSENKKPKRIPKSNEEGEIPFKYESPPYEKAILDLLDLSDNFLLYHQESARECAVKMVQSPIFLKVLKIPKNYINPYGAAKFMVRCFDILSNETIETVWESLKENILENITRNPYKVYLECVICLANLAKKLPKLFQQHESTILKVFVNLPSSFNHFLGGYYFIMKNWIAATIGYAIRNNPSLSTEPQLLKTWLDYLRTPESDVGAEECEILLDFLKDNTDILFKNKETELSDWKGLNVICMSILSDPNPVKYAELVKKAKNVVVMMNYEIISRNPNAKDDPSALIKIKALRDLEKELTRNDNE